MLNHDHCKASTIYRSERIETHTQQVRATLLALKYLSERYSKASFRSHKEAALKALFHIEETLH